MTWLKPALFSRKICFKPDKASLVKELEKNLGSTHYNFNSISSLHTSIIVDFMATIEKVTLRDLSSIGHIFQAILKRIESTWTAQDLNLVYDCYLRHSSKVYGKSGGVCSSRICRPFNEVPNTRANRLLLVLPKKHGKHRGRFEIIVKS